MRGYGRGARNGRGCARSHYRDTTQYGKRSRTREPYLAAVPWSRTAPPRARPGHDSRCRKALASKRRSCATETRKTATEAKERALSAWRSSRRRKARYGCTSGGAVTSGWGCEEHASSRRKGPRAQATETPQPVCKRFLQCRCCCGVCARQRPGRLRAAGPRRWGGGARADWAPEATARAFSSPPLHLREFFFGGWVDRVVHERLRALEPALGGD